MAYTKQTYESRRAEVNQSLQDITDNLPKYFESEQFKRYLDFSASFHNYSINNQLLILMQKPEATLVAGYRAWQEQGRQVNKGEKSIRILAPSSYKTNKLVEKTDAEGKVVMGADGLPESETKEITVQTFTPVSVFDVSQTSGEPIPEPIHNLEGNSKEAVNLIESIEMTCDAPISYHGNEDRLLQRGANGYFKRSTGEIVVSNMNSLDQQAKTLIHEWAHSRLHSEETDKPSELKEIEAEATAYVVAKHFGLNTGDYSFGYVGIYATDKTPKELHSVLVDIRSNAHEMINSIEEVYEQIQEKNKDISIDEFIAARTRSEESKTVEPEEKETEAEDKETAVGDKEMDTSDKETDIENKETDTEGKETDNLVEESNTKEDDIEAASKAAPSSEPEPSPEPEDTADTSDTQSADKKNKIEDFGEKIGGAKKDLWKAAGLTLNDVSSMTEAERASLIKKDTVWPKPNYQELKDNGLPIEVVFFIKNVRDSLSSAPVTNKSIINDFAKEQEKYVAFVSDIRDAAMACKNMDDIKHMRNFMEDHGYATRDFLFLTPTEAGGRYVTNKLLHAIQISEKELQQGIQKKGFLMCDDEKLIAKSGYEILQFDPKKMDISDERMRISDGNGLTSSYYYPEKTVDLDNMKENTWFVTRGHHIILAGFDSEPAIKTFLTSLLKVAKESETPAAEKTRKTALKPPILEHIEREGPEYRKHDATGQDYLDTFAFRGGEFGNWLNENERQGNLNMCFDAFKDLSKVLKIADTDVSMNGRLSIAFGARGKGNALAHYEPQLEVINLTKLKGAGSLGHEWIHAMDDIAGKQLGIKGMMSKADGVERKLVPESFKNLMDTIKYHKATSIREKSSIAKNTLEERKEKLKSGLYAISNEIKGSTLSPDEKPRRDELIEACVKAAGTEEAAYAYENFRNYQSKHGDKNPSHPRNVKWFEVQNKAVAEAIENCKHPEALPDYRIETTFLKDAQSIDNNFSKTGHGYWSSDSELLARAGAVYLADKCEALGIRNDYLNGHARGSTVVVKGNTVYTAPRGAEKAAINKAFDVFFEDIIDRGIFSSIEGRNLAAVVEKMEHLAAEQNVDKKVAAKAVEKGPNRTT